MARTGRWCFVVVLGLLAAPQAGVCQEGLSDLDRRLAAELSDVASDQQAAPRADDETFLRRVTLDTVGVNPTPNEVTLFVLDPSPDKRERLIDRRLNDPRFGTNWARYWRDVIVARRSSADRQILSLVSEPLERFLTEQFNANTGWDRIARSFIEAEGTIAERGETAFVLVHMAQTSSVAAEASRVFLGMQIQCAECHDHPFDTWKRPQFHEFAAFFPRVGLQRERTPDGGATLRVAAFDTGPLARRPGGQQGALEHFMPDLLKPDERGTQMSPVFFATGQSLEPGTTDAERRGSLGQWMTSPDNPWFAKAFVNRVWAELVGQGFCEPVDDLGPDRPSVAPKTWEYLAEDFAQHGYDIRRLYRSVLLSDAYQRESRPKPGPDGVPFLANVRTPLRADQFVDVLADAVGFSWEARLTENPRAFRNGPRTQLVQLFEFDPSLRREEITSSIPQVLAVMNSPVVNRVFDARGSSWFGSLVANGDDDAVVTELYLRCLARMPNDSELQICREHVAAATSRFAALEDVFWSLLNSEEIRYRN